MGRLAVAAYHVGSDMTQGSYDVGAENRDRESEVARLAAQARLGWDKEVAALERLGFRDGMSVVELGSGPGFVTEALLEHFPATQVTAVELDPTLVDDARRYLERFGDRVTFVHASAGATGLDADRFDAAYARLLFQHLPDPAATASEVFRVLRPGAPFVIYDVDDAIGIVMDPVAPSLDVVMERIARAQAARGGDRHIGRRLPRLLGGAGFRDFDLEAVAVNSETEGLEAFLPQIDTARLIPLVGMGLFTQQELESVEVERANFLAADQPFILGVVLMAGVRKPDSG